MTFAWHFFSLILAAVGASFAASLTMSVHILLTTLVAEARCRLGCSEATARLALGDEPLNSVLLFPLGSLFVVPFALMIVLPMMLVAYPLAVAITKILRTPGRTAAVGALVAPIVVAPILLSALAIFGTASERSQLVEGLLEAWITWTPAFAAAGAAVGWIVARMHSPPDATAVRASEGKAVRG